VDLVATQNPSIARNDRGVGEAIYRGQINKPDKFIDGKLKTISLIMPQDTNSGISQIDFPGAFDLEEAS
jgi:hypothetical protein